MKNLITLLLGALILSLSAGAFAKPRPGFFKGLPRQANLSDADKKKLRMAFAKKMLARANLSDAEKEKLESFRNEQKALREELQKRIDALGENADQETIKATVKAFREENVDRIKAQAEVAKGASIKLKGMKPNRAKRPEPPAAVKTKIEAVKVAHKELHTARANLREELKDVSEEKRKELIAAFKEANKDKLEELKAKEKEVREAIRGQKDTGDRRTSL